MIRSIHIENFKSVVDLTLNLGRFNILIGENGCGKSNILEAIAFAGAETMNRTDHEFLNSRGVRDVEPNLMSSAFTKKSETDAIRIKVSAEKSTINFVLTYFSPLSKWSDPGPKLYITTKEELKDTILWKIHPKELQSIIDEVNEGSINEGVPDFYIKQSIWNQYELSRFLIFSPENSVLRQFEESGQILPLGIKGEGMFSEIKRLLNGQDIGRLKDIKENLSILDWFEDFIIPSDNFANEYRIQIKDRYLEGEIQFFDQRSANEGFLFLLFYLTLFTSDKTPSFFAIDNIEASFNPKMCIKLIEVLNELSIKYNKQVIITTHNPAILDGLNLKDTEQRLFVIRRNIDGHTIATHIAEKPKTVSQIKLSEMWTRGLLGGLPNNF